MIPLSDPEGKRSPSPFLLKGIIWTALVLSDLIIGIAVAGQGFPLPERIVFLVTFLGLLLVELLLWSRMERLFR